MHTVRDLGFLTTSIADAYHDGRGQCLTGASTRLRLTVTAIHHGRSHAVGMARTAFTDARASCQANPEWEVARALQGAQGQPGIEGISSIKQVSGDCMGS